MTTRPYLTWILLVLLILLPGCALPEASSPTKPPAQPTSLPAAEADPTPAAPAQAATAQAIPTPLPLAQSPTETPSASPEAVPTAAPPPGAAALVGGQPISLAEYEAQVRVAQGYYLQQPGVDAKSEAGKVALAQLRRQVLDWMVDQVLIEQAAIREGIMVPDDQVEAEIQKMQGEDETRFNQWLVTNGLTMESFKRRLRIEMMGAILSERVAGNIPTSVEQVHVRHILLSTEEECNDVLAQLGAGSDFATLAKSSSLDQTSAPQGGDLGFFPRGLMAPEFEEAAFSLAPGEISGMIKTQFGYHILQVIEKDPSREVPPEILPALRQQAFQRWLESERANATIEFLVE